MELYEIKYRIIDLFESIDEGGTCLVIADSREQAKQKVLSYDDRITKAAIKQSGIIYLE